MSVGLSLPGACGESSASALARRSEQRSDAERVAEAIAGLQDDDQYGDAGVPTRPLIYWIWRLGPCSRNIIRIGLRVWGFG
jgi:hypothetical protein